MDITFKNVGYTYQLNTPFEHRAIDNLSFHIKSGSYVAIVGHTGSGKSTLIQHLNGLLRPSEGRVSIGEYTMSSEKKVKDMKSLRKKVGIVFQYPEHQLFDETVEKDIAFGPKNFGVSETEIKRRTQEVMKAVQLPEEMLQRSPFDLSGGQMRRAAIAGVLAMRPEVLVLDEPTAGLDPRGRTEIMNMFSQLHKSEGLTTILVTHSMEDALQYADYVIILDHGTKYMDGKPEEVFVKKEALKQVQLDVPEIIQFLFKAEEKLGISLPYHNQSISELAEQIRYAVEGAKQGE